MNEQTLPKCNIHTFINRKHEECIDKLNHYKKSIKLNEHNKNRE